MLWRTQWKALLFVGALIADALLGRPGEEGLIPSHWIRGARSGATRWGSTSLPRWPALSLPNMLVIRSVMGAKKTIVFVILVVVMATISGLIFGALYGS